MTTEAWTDQRKADTLVNIYTLAKWGLKQAEQRDDAHKRTIRKETQDAKLVLNSMIEGFIFDVEEANKSGINIRLTTAQITALRR